MVKHETPHRADAVRNRRLLETGLINICCHQISPVGYSKHRS
jgi:hypothetical protein